MEDYSFKKNIKYISHAFYRPKRLINNILHEVKLIYYSLTPLIISFI